MIHWLKRMPRWVPVVLAISIGFGSAGQSHVNGSLSSALQSGPHAAALSFGTALIVVLVFGVFKREVRQGVRRVMAALRSGELPWWGLLGGVLGAQMVFAQTFLVPLVGVAVFMTSRVVGQLVGSLSMDHFGWMGVPVRNLNWLRGIGAFLSIVAVAIVASGAEVDPRWGVYMGVGALAGFLVALQMGVTGTVRVHAQNSVSPTLLNFLVGASVLFVSALISEALGWVDPRPPPTDWWMYLGGPLGALYVFLIATIVRILGVMLLSMSIVGGQLLGSLVFDAIAGHFSWTLVGGLALAFLGITLTNVGAGRID